MPLLPELSLAGKFPQVTPYDPTQARLAAAQLGQSQTGNLLSQLRLADAAQAMQRRRAALALLQRGGQPGTPAAAPVSPLNPQAAAGPITQTPLDVPAVAAAPTTPASPPQGGMPSVDELARVGGPEGIELAKDLQAVRAGQQRTQLDEMTVQLKALEYFEGMLGAPQDQASLDAVRTELQRTAPYLANLLPQTYDREQLAQLQQRMQPLKQRMQQTQMGMTPIPGTVGGKFAVGQLSPTGQGAVVQWPQGFEPSPTLMQVPTGTGTALVPRTGPGQPTATIPKQVEEAAQLEAAGRKGGEYAGQRPQLAIKMQEQLRSVDQKQQVALQEIERAKKIIAESTLPVTGVVGDFLKQFYQPGKNLESLLAPLIAQTGFAELQSIRDGSPSGGALGPVSDNENRLLQSVTGSLQQSQGKKQLIENLDRLKDIMTKGTQARKDAYQRDFGDVQPGRRGAGSPHGQIPVEQLTPQQLDEEEAALKRLLRQ